MSAPYFDLQGKGNAALAAVVQAALTAAGDATTVVYPGLGAESALLMPRAVATCEAGQEDVEGTGNYWLQFTVTVVSLGDPSTGETNADKLAQHNTRAATVIDAISVDAATLAASLSAAVDDFTCQGIRERSLPVQHRQDRQLYTEASFMGLCCPSDLSA